MIVIHSMGKVGNTSLTTALREHPQLKDTRIFPTHVLSHAQIAKSREQFASRRLEIPSHLTWSARVVELLFEEDVPASIITPFRNPVYRNISDYFETIDLYVPDDAQEDLDALVDGFVNRYPHGSFDWWIGSQLLELFDVGIDDLDIGSTGCRSVDRGRHRFLFYRTELDDSEKQRLVADFLGIGDFEIPTLRVRSNMAGDIYRRFVSSLRLDSAILDTMLRSPLAERILSPGEIAKTREEFGTPR